MVVQDAFAMARRHFTRLEDAAASAAAPASAAPEQAPEPAPAAPAAWHTHNYVATDSCTKTNSKNS